MTESQFTDDVAIYTKARGTLESVARKIVKKASEWGLTVNMKKTKGMAIGDTLGDEDVAPVKVEDGELEMVKDFTYLGSILSRDGDDMEDVKCRTAKASRAFGCLRGPIFNNPILSSN